MKLLTLGQAPCFAQIVPRLRQQGIAVDSGISAALRHYPANAWQGLAGSGLLIDLSPQPWDSLIGRATLSRAAGCDYLELQGFWHPAGTACGFMLMAGGDEAALAHARPVLDALAPSPGAWLACGPAGAARFCNELFSGLTLLGLYGWQHASPHQQQPEQLAAQLLQLFDQQRQLALQLELSASRYLQHYQIDASASDWPDSFCPPFLHPHYAALLARLVCLTLGPLRAA